MNFKARLASRVALVMIALLGGIGLTASAASVWTGPGVTPLGLNGLRPILDFSDFVELAKVYEWTVPSNATYQWTQGAVRFSANGNHVSTLGLKMQRMINTMDSGGGSQNRYSDIALGSDNLPVISYIDQSVNDLKIRKCYDPECRDSKEVTVYNMAGSGQAADTSITIASNGYPIISFWNSTTNTLYLARCGAHDCVTGNRIIQLDSAVGTGTYSSIAMSGVIPIVSYYDATNQKVKFARCGNADCSAGTVLRTLEDAGSGSNPADADISLRLGSDNFPIISFVRTGDIRFIKCADASCSSHVVQTGLGTGSDTAVTIVETMPAVAYRQASVLYMRFCLSLDCATSLETKVDDTADVGNHVDIVTGADGFPLIVYSGPSADSIRIAKCRNAQCTPNTILTVLESSGGYRDIAATLGADDLPVLSYTAGIDTLKSAHCAIDTCEQVNAKIGAIGSGVANASAFFTPPPPSKNDLTIGVYGYAAGVAGNIYGAYGYSTNGSGIYADAVNATAYAGLFHGPMRVLNTLDSSGAALLGTLSVGRTLTASGGLVADSATYPSVNYSRSDMAFAKAVVATTTAALPDLDFDIAANGYSTDSDGVRVVAQNYRQGILAQSNTDEAIYGIATSGGMPSIIGEAAAGIVNGIGVYGESTHAGISGEGDWYISGEVWGTNTPVTNAGAGVAIFACGSEHAARFSGDLYMGTRLSAGVESETYVDDGAVSNPTLVGKLVDPEIGLTSAMIQSLCAFSSTCGYLAP